MTFFASGSLFFAVSANAADPCGFTADWLVHDRNKPAEFATIKELNAFTDKTSELLEKGAYLLYAQYRAGESLAKVVETCLPPESARSEFNRIVPKIFLQESLREFSTLHSPAPVASFIKEIEGRYASGRLNLFRLVGHNQQNSNPTGDPAGYFRPGQSIFMDVGIIPGNDWLVVLAHELSHATDDQLNDSLPIYNDPITLKQVSEWVGAYSDDTQLDAQKLATLDRWLIAGLQRGLLTEIRAWTITAAVYRAGTAQNLWRKTRWMEELLAQQVSGESDSRYLTRYLSPRFKSPTEGLFAFPLIAKRLEKIRERIVRGEILP